jgi:hypothetical protein
MATRYAEHLSRDESAWFKARMTNTLLTSSKVQVDTHPTVASCESENNEIVSNCSAANP